MSPQIRNDAIFVDILTEHGWADIDTLLEECKKRDVFGADFYDRALTLAMKAAIRRKMKSGSLRDADGNVIEIANIIMTDESGQRRRVYKQEQLFDVGDCVQVVRYWKDKIQMSQERLDHYVALAVSLHGPEIQGLLAFGE